VVVLWVLDFPRPLLAAEPPSTQLSFNDHRDASFSSWPVDIAIFDDPRNARDYQHLAIIVETKAPGKTEGRSQLEVYFRCEPHAKCGIWTNGTDYCVIYRAADGSFIEDKQARLPRPNDSLLFAGEKKIKAADLERPEVSLLKKKFTRLLEIVVARDTKSTRRDDQLNELCNLLLVKLESDKDAAIDPESDVSFQVWDNEEKTAKRINERFHSLKTTHADLFNQEFVSVINLDDHTISMAAYELGKIKLKDNSVEVIAEAFQVFRAASLKSDEGQYFTPYPVIRSAVRFMEVSPKDNVIDPACGTGGFLLESYNSLRARYPRMTEADGVKWANRHLFGVDKDRINIKLTKAVMLIVGDGSTNTFCGDSLRVSRWPKAYPALNAYCKDASFSVIITNPPFGVNLTFPKNEAKSEAYSICRIAKKKSDPSTDWKDEYEDREIGIVFLDRCWKLLKPGGCLGVILPETYFFSSSYQWLQGWLRERFELIGMLNIPMEAFQGFCRAKTNFYVLT